MTGVEPIAWLKSRYSTLIKAGEPWAREEQGVVIIALFEKRRTQKKSIALLVSTELSLEMDVERKVTKWSWVSTRPLSFLGCVELNESVISNAVQFDFLLSFLTCFRPIQKNYISRSYKRAPSPTSNISFIKRQYSSFRNNRHPGGLPAVFGSLSIVKCKINFEY